MRFYDPDEGAVLFDGLDLREVTQDSLRVQLGVVFQDTFLFDTTIAENIALGRPGASRTEIEEAARQAGLHDVVAALPEGYDTRVGERGARLSGGQRQRLAIARALLREPRLLIFDEATSHLDTATERAIQENLRTLLTGQTVLIVAHRLSTIKDADVICVMHHGRVVE